MRPGGESGLAQDFPHPAGIRGGVRDHVDGAGQHPAQLAADRVQRGLRVGQDLPGLSNGIAVSGLWIIRIFSGYGAPSRR
ncbi:hypothetical protein Psi01_00930 [Planobispora siamensis]|uniref:Uncharacterized protein n=1 Tax=Planobispora siamensis TaxID=936338 RepID=A0A8J3WHE9_9ACTN|nr:hypothetical protein Psi01_00930 [Planobispora siamensis]